MTPAGSGAASAVSDATSGGWLVGSTRAGAGAGGGTGFSGPRLLELGLHRVFLNFVFNQLGLKPGAVFLDGIQLPFELRLLRPGNF